MRYTTNYDIGDRKRGEGINEDSLSVTIFEQGHRDGYLGKTRPSVECQQPAETTDADGEAEDGSGAGDAEDLELAVTEAEDAGEAGASDADDAGTESTEDEADAGTDLADDSTDAEQTDGHAEADPADDAEQTDGDAEADPVDDAEQADGDADTDPADDVGGSDDTDIYVAPAEGEADSEPTGEATTAQATDVTGADAHPADKADAHPADKADAHPADKADDPAEMPANRSASVFVLADGAGGHDAGDVASYIATTVVAENLAPVAINAVRSHPEEFDIDIDPAVLPETLGPEDIQTGLENAIIKAHREIIRYASESGTQSYTTVVAGVYADGHLHLGWVGDSRAYLVNDARSEIVPLTKDHAVVEELADEGEIDEVEAHVHPDGNQITRALGGSGHENPDRAMVDVDTRSVRLFAEDTVLATSDGLIDAQTDAPQLYREYVEAGRSEASAETVREAVVTDEEIRDVLLSAETLDDAATEYVRLANERGGKDNISVLLFEDETLPPTPTGGMPVRAVDPDVDLSERDTVIITEN